MTAGTRAAISADEPQLTLDDRALARDYERISAERQFLSGKKLVQKLAVAAGERVLDLGCGTGLLAAHIADLVGPSGHVLGLDPLPLRIELAQAKARANLEFRVGNAYALDDLPDSGFDVACLNAVFHWLPEKTGPLRQLARILRPGGRLGMSSGMTHRTRMHEVVAEVLSQPPFGDHPRPRGELTYRVSEAEMRDLLANAGFVPASIEVQETVHLFPSPEAAIRFSEASSFGNFLGHLPAGLRAEAREALKHALASIATPDGIRREGRRIIVVAVRQ